MKKILFPMLMIAALSSCSNANDGKPAADTMKKDSVAMQFFGDTINADGAVAAATVESRLAGKDTIAIKLEGKVTDVCQKKGCWMELDLGNNKSIHVTFKDYAFFVPKDCGGKTAVVDGRAYYDVTSVEDLREIAHDRGMSKDSVNMINQPEKQLVFEANGVIIRN